MSNEVARPDNRYRCHQLTDAAQNPPHLPMLFPFLQFTLLSLWYVSALHTTFNIPSGRLAYPEAVSSCSTSVDGSLVHQNGNQLKRVEKRCRSVSRCNSASNSRKPQKAHSKMQSRPTSVEQQYNTQAHEQGPKQPAPARSTQCAPSAHLNEVDPKYSTQCLFHACMNARTSEDVFHYILQSRRDPVNTTRGHSSRTW